MNLVWCLLCLLAVNVFASTGRKKEQLEKKISSINVLRLSTTDTYTLYGKLESVSLLLSSATSDGLLADREVLNAFVKLYTGILKRITPGIFKCPKCVILSNFACDFTELNEALKGNWPVESSVLLQASKLLYSCFYYPGIVSTTRSKLNNFQESCFKEFNNAEVLEILDFMVEHLNPELPLVTALFFNLKPFGHLTVELKVHAIKLCLDKIINLSRNHFTMAMGMNLPSFAFVSCVMHEWDDQLLAMSWKLLNFNDHFDVACVETILDTFKVVKVGLETRSGPSVCMVLDMMINSNFSKQIAEEFSSFPADQVSVFENVIFYIYLTSSVERTLQAIKEPLKTLILQTAESLAPKIDLARRIARPFDGISYADEIELLLEVYDQQFFKTLPKECADEIRKRLSDSQDYCVQFDDHLHLLAVVLSGLVYSKHFKADDSTPYFYLFTFLKLNILDEVPESWKVRFERILREQIPRMVKLIINSKITVLPEDLANCVDLLLQYNPKQVAKFAASIAATSGKPEIFLDVLAHREDLFQLTLLELLLKGVKVKPESLQISSTFKEIMNFVQQN